MKIIRVEYVESKELDEVVIDDANVHVERLDGEVVWMSVSDRNDPTKCVTCTFYSRSPIRIRFEDETS